MVRKFPLFCSGPKKRTTSDGSPQFSNDFPVKLLFHLTFRRNFWILWPNGNDPSCVQTIAVLKVDLDVEVKIDKMTTEKLEKKIFPLPL